MGLYLHHFADTFTQNNDEKSAPHLDDVQQTLIWQPNDWASIVSIDLRQCPFEQYEAHGRFSSQTSQSFRQRLLQLALESGGSIQTNFPNRLLFLFCPDNGSKNHAQQAVSSAYAILELLVATNRQRMFAGQFPISVGIGIHTIQCVQKAADESSPSRTLREGITAVQQISALNSEAPVHTLYLTQSTRNQLMHTPLVHVTDELGEVSIHTPRPRSFRVYALIYGRFAS